MPGGMGHSEWIASAKLCLQSVRAEPEPLRPVYLQSKGEMEKERLELDLSLIELNEGQLSWLPKNPRTWTQTDIDKTAASIKQDPDFLEDRPLLVVSREDSPNLVVFAGNLRSVGARAARLSRVPCVLYSPEEDEDYETIRRRAMKDNGSFGQFDWDEVFSSPWGQMDLDSMGIGKAFQQGGTHSEGEGDAGNPDDYGTEFSLPDGEKAGFRQVSFQLSDEMAETLLFAQKVAHYTKAFYEIEGDDEDKNGNGVALYVIARDWLDGITKAGAQDRDKAKAQAEELRQYLRDALKASGHKAKDVDELLGTAGMSGHYFGESQWLFPTREAYEKMRKIMPLDRDYMECKLIELCYNLARTLEEKK